MNTAAPEFIGESPVPYPVGYTVYTAKGGSDRLVYDPIWSPSLPWKLCLGGTMRRQYETLGAAKQDTLYVTWETDAARENRLSRALGILVHMKPDCTGAHATGLGCVNCDANWEEATECRGCGKRIPVRGATPGSPRLSPPSYFCSHLCFKDYAS